MTRAKEYPTTGGTRTCITQTADELRDCVRGASAHGHMLVDSPRPVNEYEYAYRWEERSDMVKHAGRWRKKIDFCMEILSPHNVMQEIRAITGGKPLSELVSMKGWSPAFRTCVDVMTERARRQVEAERQKRLSTGDFTEL